MVLNPVLLGWIIVVIGIIATLAGIVGAIAQLMKDIQKREGRGTLDLPTDFLDALRALVETLMKAPTWLVLLVFGFGLIVYGGTLIK
jgi:hypothetical protein